MNRILKQRARQLYKGGFGGVFAAYLMCSAYMGLTTWLPMSLQRRLPQYGFDFDGAYLIALLARFLVSALLMPILLGANRYSYLLHKDRSPRYLEVFYFFSRPSRYAKGVGAGLMINAFGYLSYFLVGLLDYTIGYGDIIIPLVALGAAVFHIYWMFHCSLVRYILVEDEEVELGHARQESFRLMEGNCGRFFLLELSFIGWYLLLFVGMMVLTMVLVMPVLMDLSLEGAPSFYMEEALAPIFVGVEAVFYFAYAFLTPYVGLSNAAFGDMALQGRLEELEWQGRAPLYGGWQQFPGPPQEQYFPYPPQYPPQGPPWQPGMTPPQAPQQPYAAPWQGQPSPAWDQPAYTAAQQEEALQYSRYCQGQPMEPKSFTTCGETENLFAFRPWMQVERGGLYSFLKLESWMPGMVSAVWSQALQGISSAAQNPEAMSQRSLEESLSGTRFRVTVIISGYPTRPGAYKIYINIDLNPQDC